MSRGRDSVQHPRSGRNDRHLARDPPEVGGALRHRLASPSAERVSRVQRGDAALLRWVKARVDGGALVSTASEALRDRLSVLRTLIGRSDGPLFVTACMPGEQHEIGALILGLLAGRAGYRVLHLGASPSPEGLKRAVIDLKPAVLGLSVSNPDLLRSHAEWLDGVSALARRRSPRSVLVVVGLGITEVTQPVGGFSPVCGDAGAALEQIRELTRPRTPESFSARQE